MCFNYCPSPQDQLAVLGEQQEGNWISLLTFLLFFLTNSFFTSLSLSLPLSSPHETSIALKIFQIPPAFSQVLTILEKNIAKSYIYGKKLFLSKWEWLGIIFLITCIRKSYHSCIITKPQPLVEHHNFFVIHFESPVLSNQMFSIFFIK